MTRPPLLIAASIALLLAAAPSSLAAADALDAEAGRSADDDARRLVRDRVERQIEALEQSIFALEASQPKRSLMQRRFTVETFLMAAIVPQAIVFASQPDLAPLWRQDFRGEPRILSGPPGWLGRAALLGSESADAIAGRFVVEMLEPVDGDEAIAIGGRFVVGADSATLAATWCEPCLHPESVDFPIVPEAFLLAWNESDREVATLRPEPLSHRESVRDESPRLDQPEDLFDLFDGLRALPPAMETLPPHRSDRSGRDDREPHAATTHVSHDVRGIELQRVVVETDPRSGDLVVRIDQPPVACRWSSPRRYELRGDVAGDPTAVRSIVPQGEISSLAAPITATFRIRTGSIVGTVRRGDALLATLRWDSITPLTAAMAREETVRLREPFREASARPLLDPAVVETGGADSIQESIDARAARTDPFAPEALDLVRVLDVPDAVDAADAHDALDALGALDSLDGLDALDPIGADLRRVRQEFLAAVTLDDRDALARAFGRHRRLIAEQSLDPSTLWRGIEAHAEFLAAVEATDALWRSIDGPGSAALAMAPSESLLLMLADRLRMGRFAGAMLIAGALTRREDTSDAARSWAERVHTQLVDALRPHARHRPVLAATPLPRWWEPPGRSRLATLVAARLVETLVDSRMPSTHRSTGLLPAYAETPRATQETLR